MHYIDQKCKNVLIMLFVWTSYSSNNPKNHVFYKLLFSTTVIDIDKTRMVPRASNQHTRMSSERSCDTGVIAD